MSTKKQAPVKKNITKAVEKKPAQFNEDELKEKLKAIEDAKNTEFEAAFKKFAEEWKLQLQPVLNIGGQKYMPDAVFSQTVKIEIVIKRSN